MQSNTIKSIKRSKTLGDVLTIGISYAAVTMIDHAIRNGFVYFQIPIQ